jgi:hemerythrin-like domain-containing protein
MSALLSLTEEHQTISGLLGALHTYAMRLRSGATVDPLDLGRFAEVLRELVDYRHHEKEEGILMPLLARNGFEWSTGLLAELRHEHGHLRHLIDVLCQAAAKDSVGSPEQCRQIVDVALAFVEYKREHIRKEDEVLFTAVVERLDARSLEQLGAELARFDRATAAVAPAGAVAPFEAMRDPNGPIATLASELVQRYSVDSGTVDVTALRWLGAGKPFEVVQASIELGARTRRPATSFGRSR